MPQIDLEPKDYSAEPVKGEPVFVPGAGRRALIWCIGLTIAIIVAIAVQFLMSPLEPFVRSLAGISSNSERLP